MAASKKSAGMIVTQVAVVIFLIVMGIMTLQLNSSSTGWTGFDNVLGSAKAGVNGNEIASAVYSLFGVKSPVAKPVIIVLGICEILGGAFLCINLFISTGKLENLFLVIILVMWCAVIVLVDFAGKTGISSVKWNSMSSILSYLKGLSAHLLVLGALFTVMERH